MAVMSLLAYLLHFNSVVNFIRESALIGFKAGAAITIVLTQFPKLFGIPGGGNGFFERAGILIGQLPETNLKVLVFGILKGVVLAAIVSILLLLRALANPSVTFLGRIPGTKRYGDISRHPDNETIPGLLLIRVEASLFYFIIENIRSSVWAEIQKSESTLKCIIWDLSTSAYVDIAGARFIKKLYLELKAKEISLKIAEAHSRVRDMLRSEGIEELLGHISRRTSVDDLVKEYEGNQY
jgi:MFS superfamily sulfate permease-like transporter